MTLCDAGPLVALIDTGDEHHHRCSAALEEVENLISTWHCLVEAMYLLYRSGGHKAQEALWAFWENGLLNVYVTEGEEWTRMRDLMRKYHDTPMDLADASLVCAAEQLGIRHVFTVDSHFRAYRIEDQHAFEILP